MAIDPRMSEQQLQREADLLEERMITGKWFGYLGAVVMLVDLMALTFAFFAKLGLLMVFGGLFYMQYAKYRFGLLKRWVAWLIVDLILLAGTWWLFSMVT